MLPFHDLHRVPKEFEGLPPLIERLGAHRGGLHQNRAERLEECCRVLRRLVGGTRFVELGERLAGAVVTGA